MKRESNLVSWFEIPVLDLPRAIKFYEQVFEIELHEMSMGPYLMACFPHEKNIMGAGGTLVKGDGFKPSHEGSLLYFSVSNIDEAMSRVLEQGGKILMPKMSIGEYGFMAYFEDSEGNKVALHCMG
jgi:uncharacterized protein